MSTLPNSSRGRSAVTDLLKQTSTVPKKDVKDKSTPGSVKLEPHLIQQAKLMSETNCTLIEKK